MSYYWQLSRVELEYVDEDLKLNVIVFFQNVRCFSWFLVLVQTLYELYQHV